MQFNINKITTVLYIPVHSTILFLTQSTNLTKLTLA